MAGLLGFVVTVLYLLGKLIFYFLLFMIHASVRLSRNTSQFIHSRWKDIVLCFTISVLLTHWLERSRDGVYLLIYVSIFAVSLLATHFILSVWNLHKKKVKILFRYTFRKSFLARIYINSKENPDQ